MATTIQARRDTAANWTSSNPTLAAGEMGWESDTNKLKWGDGVTAWTSLNYFTTGAVPQVLYKIGIPFIMPSGASMNMGNNGALTSVAGLNTTYAKCYCYFPANQIFAGSTAGWYYTTFSSATAATVFNNTYVSGIPTIPASPTSFVTTGPGAITQTTGSDITVHTLAVAGSTIDLTGQFVIDMLVANGGVATNKIYKAAYGGTGFLSTTQTSNKSFAAYRTVANRGATNAQVSETLASAGFNATAGAPTYLSIDTTASQNFTTTMQLQAGTDSPVFEYIAILAL